MPDTPSKTDKPVKCGYCKAVVPIDPKFPHKKFCNDTHRKLFWKYGSMSVGKVAERMERDLMKKMEARMRALCVVLGIPENSLDLPAKRTASSERTA